MCRLRFTFILALAATASTAYAQSSPANRPWPPGVQKVPDESPALSPQEALQTFYMPPGYRIELVASEPLVRDPVAIDWDDMGRLWVVEMPGFVRNLELPEPNLDPIGRIVVLEDLDGDGRMDKRTVFADGLIMPRAVKVLDRGRVLVGEPPHVWLMYDRDGDLRADTRESITDRYGSRDGNVELNANGLHWGMDNAIHTTHVDIYLHPKQGGFEVRRTLSSGGQWGLTHDDMGRIYRNRNESALHVDLVPTPYFARNPNLLRTRGTHVDLRDENNELNVVWPVRPNPGTNRAYQFGIDREDGSLAKFTAVCAPLVYRGDRLPKELYGNVFVPEPAANLVGRIIVEEEGGTLHTRKAYRKGEFLASTDERFRPVFLSNAPDGTLYIVDMYRGIIQQRVDITEYLRDYIVKKRLEEPIELGRIYRVMHETTRRDTAPAYATASSAELIEALSHPSGWRRDLAQQLLVLRGDKRVVPALVRLAEGAPNLRTRLHALWTLDGLEAVEPATVTKALVDSSAHMRAAAIRIAERWLGEPGHRLQSAVLARQEDESPTVRYQLAASLGTLPPGPRENAVVALVERFGDDPITLDAALSAVRGGEATVLKELVHTGEGRTAQREAAMTMLAAMLIRSRQDAAVQDVFAWITDDSQPLWQRSVLLAGAEVALLGATMPGTPVRRPAASKTPCPICGVNPAGPNGAPCLTCPGGRAGPGGAFAFRKVAAPAAGRGPVMRLSREPARLSALAGGKSELAPRAARVLTRLEWPGKPGAMAVTPLTRAEQQRYDAGKEIYRNLCQTCHQPDGRGQEKIAPSLIDSPLVLGPSEIVVRILLNGKDGSTGLMPPLGSVLSDEKVAEVVTYIRREWGQTGSPVDAPAVAAVRALVTGRDRPWTDDELTALLSANGRSRQQ